MTPDVSVVVALDANASGDAVLRAIDAQTIVERIEVIVVGPDSSVCDAMRTRAPCLRTTVRGVIADRVFGPWLWAGLRSARWSIARRALYALAFPLLPLAFYVRLFRSDGWRDHRENFPRGTIAVLTLYAPLIAFGELLGYVSGPDVAARRHVPIELHRERYL